MYIRTEGKLGKPSFSHIVKELHHSVIPGQFMIRIDINTAVAYHSAMDEGESTDSVGSSTVSSSFSTPNAIDTDLTKDSSDTTPLPESFVPATSDVLIGTGREAKIHAGNYEFHKLLEESFIERYANASYKLDKTIIISEIVAKVRENSPTKSGFVKKMKSRWHKVGDHLARETVSQGLRNLLHNRYRSSTKAKKKRRSLIRKEIDNSFDLMLQSKRSFLARRMALLLNEMKERGGNKAPDHEVLQLFSQANKDILEGIKQDVYIQSKLNQSILKATFSNGNEDNGFDLSQSSRASTLSENQSGDIKQLVKRTYLSGTLM